MKFTRETDVDVAIYDYLGKIIFHKHYPLTSAELSDEVDLTKQAEGTYFVVITAGEETHLRKLVKIE